MRTDRGSFILAQSPGQPVEYRRILHLQEVQIACDIGGQEFFLDRVHAKGRQTDVLLAPVPGNIGDQETHARGDIRITHCL